MPLYVYQCPSCRTRYSVVRKIAHINDPAPCPACAVPGERQLSAPMVAPDYPPYECPVTGRLIQGRREHTENLKRLGCRVYEPGETQEFLRRKAERQREAERQIDEIVDRAAASMGLL